MMTRNEIIEAWCDLIRTALGIPAVRSRQRDVPKPEAPQFATVWVMGLNSGGVPDISYTNNDEDLDENLENRMFMVASINFYREYRSAPIDLAETFRMYLYSSDGRIALRESGLGAGGITPTRDLSDLERTQWEERQQYDIQFSVKTEYSRPVLSMTSAEVVGTIQADGNEYQIEG